LDVRPDGADERLSTLSSLLSSLEEGGCADPMAQSPPDEIHQSQLARNRLGVASSLFTALRAKHAPTAAHCLRVALGVSSWSLALKFSESQRDLVEVASLLHDIGKIGVPDHVLVKPGKLTGEELLLMERHCQIGREILSGCCASPELLDVVKYATAWYDGSKHGFDRQGDDLPLGSRMIAIVDAFDAMTTDHVYRRAMSRERAMAELYACAASQFDAELVKSFCNLLGDRQGEFQGDVARRWLQQIQPDSSNSLWALRPVGRSQTESRGEAAFHDRLLDTMRDGVLFVDDQLVVLMWNRAAERLTGVACSSVLGHQWSPALVQLHDERDQPVNDTDCPVVDAMRSGVQTLRRLSVAGRAGRRISVDLHVAPVSTTGGQVRGAALILHDASSQITLEERVQTLHERATRDPLTRVANRAEFDRVFPKFVETHLEQGLPCSLIICDVDHFKRVNDTHGHQAGDEALVTFASLLKRGARAGDLVSRYGGEEFVVLCADCDNATATRRAEEMRRAVAETPQPVLGNKHITASFGVTEIQGGDTPDTFLRRADRALLQAKDGGRNLVVQLGTGINDPQGGSGKSGFWGWLRGTPGETLLERSLITIVPLKVAAEKLRGFVADHHAELLSIEDNRVCLKIDGQYTPLVRRSSDRPVPFVIEMTFEERRPPEGARSTDTLGTIIHVQVRPRRQRDRRRREAMERARQLLVSLKSYLMAHDHTEGGLHGDDKASDTVIRRAAHVLTYWLR
jgi:diguanylate cyclase (GGDEF)-like protein/PAS domain S-box-containing protein